jgi:DNA primase
LRLDVRKLLDSLEMSVEERLSDSDHLVCRCPTGDHPDRKPSFAIRCSGDDRDGLYLCRSCGFSGNAVQLVMRLLDIGHAVARQWVEERATTEAPVPERAAYRPEPPPGGFRLPPGVVVAPLEEWPTPARRYAQDRRGIEPWQVDRWGLGYASGGRLDGRIVLPVRDREGRLASYVARAYAGQPVRYLTPREEEGADPGVLFGEEHAWEHPAGAGCVVVEGALNALAVERACEGPVLALGGASRVSGREGVPMPTIAKLSRFRFVVVATDSDPAGDKAAAALLSALASYLPVARARLPEGLDPANAPGELLGEVLASAVADVW